MIRAAGALAGGRAITISFALVLAVVLALVCAAIGRVRARPRGGATGFHACGHALSGPRNGLALAGASLSAASFLGVTGMIASSGYDGLVYSAGLVVSWLPALLVAGPMRNAGRFTMADVLAARAARPSAVRVAAAVSAVTVSVCYLVALMAGAGALAGLLLGVRHGARFHGVPVGTAQIVTIAAAGALVICCVAFGGMKGTTWVQIAAAALLTTGAIVPALLVLARFGFGPDRLLDAAARGDGAGRAFLESGTRYDPHVAGHPSRTLDARLDLVSLALTLVLGTAGLPHILARFSAVRTARAARTSVNWAIGLAGALSPMAVTIGLGAAALVGRQRILARDPAGGDIVLGLVAAAAFAVIVAMAAGLVAAASTSLAHDAALSAYRTAHAVPVRHTKSISWPAPAGCPRPG